MPKLCLTLLLALFTLPLAAAEGMINVASDFSVAETAETAASR